MANCYHPSRSNQNRTKRFLGFFEKFSGVSGGEGSMNLSSTPNPNPNMSPSNNQLVPLALSRGQVIIANPVADFRPVSKQIRVIQSDSNQKKKNSTCAFFAKSVFNCANLWHLH
jgi:hypothetical protein